MKKLIIIATMFLSLLGFSRTGIAEVRVNIGIPSPPPFVFAAPPELVVIPETYVYYYPDVDFDLFFYGGYWYRPYRAYWFRSENYGGPWVHIERPPSVLLSLPPDYRVITREGRHIPYGELHRNWRAWERGRYWEHNNWGRLEHERHQGVAPPYRERGHGGYGGEVHGGGRSNGRSEGGHGEGGHEGHERR